VIEEAVEFGTARYRTRTRSYIEREVGDTATWVSDTKDLVLPHQVASTLRTTVNPSENFRRSRLEFCDRGISRKRRRGAVVTAARFTPSHLLHEEISR
jgi:hypothetical protein